MKRFLIASAAVLLVAFATATSAQAQIVYGYTAPQGNGIATTRTAVTPFGYQTYNSFYSPFTGLQAQQLYGSNVFGQAYGRSAVYNPFTGLGYNGGFYQPNYYAFPYGGFNYGNYFYGRRW